MANQPKPAPRPEPPKPTPKPGPAGATAASQPKPGERDPSHPDHPANKPPSQPPNQPHPGQDHPNPQHKPGDKPEHERGDRDDDEDGDRQSLHGERALTDDDIGLIHDERLDPDNPDRDRARDRRTGEIPGTPYTPPEGHDHREPGPGEPGGPGKPGGNLAPPPRTIADEQRERSDRYATQGVDRVKAAHDERDPADRASNTRQVPGVSPTAGVTPGEPGAIRR